MTTNEEITSRIIDGDKEIGNISVLRDLLIKACNEARADQEEKDKIFYTHRVYVRDSLANILKEQRKENAKAIFKELDNMGMRKTECHDDCSRDGDCKGVLLDFHEEDYVALKKRMGL